MSEIDKTWAAVKAAHADALAAKDREIAALREAVERLLIEIEGPPPYATERRVAFARAALSASPAPDPASVPPWERKAPCPCGAPIGAGCTREKEPGFRGCWILGGPMPLAPDPAEAMRAKCEEICRELAQGYCKGGWDGERMGVVRAMNAIAALKGNGEGR